MWSAWATDVAATPGDKRMVLDAPVATDRGRPITGKVAYDLIVNAPGTGRSLHRQCSGPPIRRRAKARRRRAHRARAAGRRAAADPAQTHGRSQRPTGGEHADRDQARGRLSAGPHLSAHLHGARSDRGRARDGGHPRSPVLSPGQPARRRAGAAQEHHFRHLAVRPAHSDHAAARPACRRGRQAGIRWRVHPCRRRRQGRLRLSLRHADAAFQRARRPHLSDRLLSVHHRDGARSGDGSGGLGAGPRASARCGAETVLRQQLVGVLESRRFPDRHRSGGQARPAARARGAHLSHRRRAALCRAAARARHVHQLRQHAQPLPGDARADGAVCRLGPGRCRAAAEHLSADRRRHAGDGAGVQGGVSAHTECPAAGNQPASAAARLRAPFRDRADRRHRAAEAGSAVRGAGAAARCRRPRPRRHPASRDAGAARHPYRLQHAQRCGRISLGHRPLGRLVRAVCAHRAGTAGPPATRARRLPRAMPAAARTSKKCGPPRPMSSARGFCCPRMPIRW